MTATFSSILESIDRNDAQILLDMFETTIMTRELGHAPDAFLFEDEIREILRSAGNGTEVTCYDANEYDAQFKVYRSPDNGNVYVDMYRDVVVTEDYITEYIYDALESNRYVTVNDTDILNL
jgi:hypothetical protein